MRRTTRVSRQPLSKWPASIMLERHSRSAFNALDRRKAESKAYQAFLHAYEENPDGPKARRLARAARDDIFLGIGDWSTPLDPDGLAQAVQTGRGLAKSGLPVPDVIHCSPYRRTLDTKDALIEGWPALSRVKFYKDERLREQEHGLKLLYPDWRIFECLFPDQRELRRIEGPYWYRCPQGENVPDMRVRLKDWLDTIMREFAGQHVLAISHHLCILGVRAMLERWDAEQFIYVDENDKPKNCHITRYKAVPGGKRGRLKLDFYNRMYA